MPLPGTTTTLPATNNSDANFRAWGSGISAKLAEAGLVQTADAGQINWATVLAPAASSTVQGYEVWRFADALQATVPVFFKIEYGSGATNLNNPGIWFTLGSGSNGTGTLTGVLSTRLQFYSSSYTSNVLSCYWCGDTNRFVMALFAAGVGAVVTTSMLLSFERTVDANGDVTSEGVLVLGRGGSAGAAHQALAWHCTTGNMTTIPETTFGALLPQTGTGTTGTSVGIYPIFHQKGIFLNPGLNVLVYMYGAIGEGVPFFFTLYGISRQFMPVGTSASAASAGTTWTGLGGRAGAIVDKPSYMIRYDA